jgi:hypothetical protein
MTTAGRGRERPRTGLRALKAAVKVRGLAAIDRRTHAARALIAWRSELVADLGGEAAITSAQRGLIEIAARTRLFLDHVDACLLGQPKLVNRRGRLIPLVEQRQRLADTLARILGQLGLERRAAPLGSIEDLLQSVGAPGTGGARA